MSIHTQLILKILFERHVEKSNFDRRKRVSISDFCDEWQRRVCIIHQSLVKTRAFRHVCAQLVDATRLPRQRWLSPLLQRMTLLLVGCFVR